MTKREPRTLAVESVRHPVLPPGTGERFAGYGVMGLPFPNGHYLAMRHFPSSSIGPGYRAVWHRDPAGKWTIYADAAPEVSCARYFGAALAATALAPIELDWGGPRSLTVRVAEVLTWTIELAPTAATRLMTTAADLMLESLWHNDSVLSAMGAMAGPMLNAGRLRLAGVTPNGQSFQAGPRVLWAISSSRAVLQGADLGPPGPLPEQDRLGDFWLPQRGLFFLAQTRFLASTAGASVRHSSSSVGSPS
jgi:hypothetical protein